MINGDSAICSVAQGGRQRGGGIKESVTGLNVEVVLEIRRTFPLTDETFPFSLFADSQNSVQIDFVWFSVSQNVAECG